MLAEDIQKNLINLMRENHLTAKDIQQVVAEKGYYSIDTPIHNYDEGFIRSVLIGAWPQIFNALKNQY